MKGFEAMGAGPGRVFPDHSGAGCLFVMLVGAGTIIMAAILWPGALKLIAFMIITVALALSLVAFVGIIAGAAINLYRRRFPRG